MFYIFIFSPVKNLGLFKFNHDEKIKKMKKSIQATFLLLSAILLFSCSSSTKLVGTWQNQEITNNQFKKIGVAALTPDNSSRYLIERAITKNLKEQNISAHETYEIFPFAGKMGEIVSKSENPEALKERIKRKVEENGFDALIIVSLLDKQKEQRFVQSHNSYDYLGGTGYYGTPRVVPGAAAMPFAYGAYYNYYVYNFDNSYQSGYYVDDVTYFLECNLFDVEKEELLWTARTKSTNIKSVEEEATKFAEMVVKDMVSKKVVIP
jgi:hypothetical protein